jgi:hypothetical protein
MGRDHVHNGDVLWGKFDNDGVVTVVDRAHFLEKPVPVYRQQQR